MNVLNDMDIDIYDTVPSDGVMNELVMVWGPLPLLNHGFQAAFQTKGYFGGLV